MFVCRILVGDYTMGHSSYNRPPSKDGGDTNFYNSCVNDVHNPSIFVVFEKHQIYPEYLITYSETSQPSSPYSYPSAVNSRAYSATASTSQLKPAPRVQTLTSAYQPKPSAMVQRSTPTYQPKPAATVRTAAPMYQPRPATASYSPAYSSHSYSRPSTPQRSKSDNSCAIC